MTKIEALKIALACMDDTDAKDVIAKMIVQSENRAESRAEKRNAFVAEIMPKLFAVMGTDEESAQTARAIFENVKSELPEDVTLPKIQSVLLKHADVVVIDNGRNPKTYFHKVA